MTDRRPGAVEVGGLGQGMRHPLTASPDARGGGLLDAGLLGEVFDEEESIEVDPFTGLCKAPWDGELEQGEKRVMGGKGGKGWLCADGHQGFSAQLCPEGDALGGDDSDMDGLHLFPDSPMSCAFDVHPRPSTILKSIVGAIEMSWTLDPRHSTLNH